MHYMRVNIVQKCSETATVSCKPMAERRGELTISENCSIIAHYSHLRNFNYTKLFVFPMCHHMKDLEGELLVEA